MHRPRFPCSACGYLYRPQPTVQVPSVLLLIFISLCCTPFPPLHGKPIHPTSLSGGCSSYRARALTSHGQLPHKCTAPHPAWGCPPQFTQAWTFCARLSHMWSHSLPYSPFRPSLCIDTLFTLLMLRLCRARLPLCGCPPHSSQALHPAPGHHRSPCPNAIDCLALLHLITSGLNCSRKGKKGVLRIF